MPEAEVALRLAEFILSLPGSGAMASVAIDGASIKVGDAVIFDIGWALHYPWELRNGKPFLGMLNGSCVPGPGLETLLANYPPTMPVRHAGF